MASGEPILTQEQKLEFDGLEKRKPFSIQAQSKCAKKFRSFMK